MLETFAAIGAMLALLIGVGMWSDHRRQVRFAKFIKERRRRRERSNPQGYWKGVE